MSKSGWERKIVHNYKLDLYSGNTYVSLISSSLNTCTVSVLDDARRKSESGEKAREKMVAQRFMPRRNSWSLAPSVTLNTRITVPFSEAVATWRGEGEKDATKMEIN